MYAEEYYRLRLEVIQLLRKEADALNLAAELIRTGNLTTPPWVYEVLRTADLCRAERAVLIEQLRDIDPFSHVDENTSADPGTL